MATTCGSCSTLKKAVVKNHMECFRKNISVFKPYRSSVIKKKDGAEALVEAAKMGSHYFLKELIEAGADVNPGYRFDESALAAAMHEGHDSCVYMLIEAGADVNKPLKYGFIEQLLLAYAVISGREEYVNVLIKAGADVNQTDENNQTALLTAASFGYHSTVDILIEAGADVNVETPEPETSPLLAVLSSNEKNIKSETHYFNLDFRPELRNVTKCVSSLIQAGADVNMKTIDGLTSLIISVENESAEFVKLLVDAGADVNLRNDWGHTALMKATEKNNQAGIDILLNSGADVNTADNGGCTVLMKSVSLAPEYVKCFIDKGADVNATDCYGYSPFMHAAKDGNLDALKKLRHLNKNINQQSKLGSTAVIFAAENGHGDCVNYLVESGADVNIQNRAGATALHRSAAMSHVLCVNELIKAGADVNVTNMLKNTVLIAAAETGSVSCITAVLKEGALIKPIKGCQCQCPSGSIVQYTSRNKVWFLIAVCSRRKSTFISLCNDSRMATIQRCKTEAETHLPTGNQKNSTGTGSASSSVRQDSKAGFTQISDVILVV